jgi:predicted MFS family arabinose efflux permease
MDFAIRQTGWRTVFAAMALITLLIGLVIHFAVPERGAPSAAETLGSQIRSVGRIYRDPAFLALAPMLASTAGAHIALQTLWAGLWLRDIAGLGRIEVAQYLFAMAAAFFAGILGSGGIADFFRRRGVSELTVMIGFLALFLASQALILVDIVPVRFAAWLAFGLSGQVAVLAYPFLSSHFGARLSGRANTAMNLLLFAAAFLAQYAVGHIIDLYPRTSTGGYPRQAYTVAFGVLLAVQLLATAWYLANRRHFLSDRASRTAAPGQ